MKPFRAAMLLLVGSWGLLSSAPGCGTDARGVEACRRIEQARCEAAPACGLVSDARACSRFYRDHCLHGLVARAPSASRIAECESAIREAGACAKSPEDDLSACLGNMTPTSACEAIQNPETLAACAFLDPSPGEEGTGGQGAAGQGTVGQATGGQTGGETGGQSAGQTGGQTGEVSGGSGSGGVPASGGGSGEPEIPEGASEESSGGAPALPPSSGGSSTSEGGSSALSEGGMSATE